MRTPLRSGTCLVAACGLAIAAWAQPTATTWLGDGPDDTASVAAAALAGWYAAGDSFEDSVELRHVDQQLIRTITRARIAALVPWMMLDGSSDGVGALALSDSGRLLFIAVHDTNAATDGLGSDAILRYDTDTDQLQMFMRLEISNSGGAWPHGAMTHFAGRLYVGTLGSVRVFTAGRNDQFGSILPAWAVPGGQMVTGLAVDRINNLLFAASNGTIFRTPVSGSGSGTFTSVGAVANVRALAWSDHALRQSGGVGGAGGAGQGGLYALDGTDSPGFGRVRFISTAQLRGLAAFAPVVYTSANTNWHDLAATADGRLLIGADEDAVLIRDASDARLDFAAWRQNEFAQHVVFAKSMITPNFAPMGTPAGWVIDADVASGSRFHPATPDAAAWAVLLLIAADQVNGDVQSQGLVRQILTRYAGRAADGIVPRRSIDGQYTHWIDPMTGQVKPGWSNEIATLSTMLISTAAARAGVYYANDLEIVESARAIVCGVTNWDGYVAFPSLQMFFQAEAGGGPVFSSASNGLHEGLLYMDLGLEYGSLQVGAVANSWYNTATWPTASYVTGRPTRGNGVNSQLPVFVHAYPMLTLARYRANLAWHGAPTSHTANVRVSHAGWTDDNGPRYATAFSAGTTFAQFGGYRADNLNDHPGDFAHFPALIALSASRPMGQGTPELVGAYAAYRAGARQSFSGGASLLWRRSNLAPTMGLNDAGMPDVTFAGLALAESMMPGFLDASIANGYVRCGCVADFNVDGGVTGDDISAFFLAYEAGDGASDVNQDGGTTGDDISFFFAAYEGGC